MATSPLQTELALPAYTSLSDQQAADLLNKLIPDGYQLVDTADILTLLIHSGELPAIGAKALMPSDPAFAICYCAVEYIRTHQKLSLDPATADGAKAVELLAGLLAANLISQATAATIKTMASKTTTRAKQIHFATRGAGVITTADVQKARA